MTAAKVELGRFLFFDKKLSANQEQSCGSCHQPRARLHRRACAGRRLNRRYPPAKLDEHRQRGLRGVIDLGQRGCRVVGEAGARSRCSAKIPIELGMANMEDELAAPDAR